MEADLVYVVEMLDRTIVCTCAVEPAGFAVIADFLCAVKDPCELVSAGYHDARPRLAGYLRRAIGDRASPLRNTRDEAKVQAEIRAFVKLSPPKFVGLQVELAECRISAAADTEGGG